MGNRVYASHSIRIIRGLVGLLAALLIISPLVANAASVAALTKRLCDRQSVLGSRLIRFLIDPNICNPTPEPTVTLTADPTTIQEGNSSTLEWSSTNATSCEASNGWSGAKDVSGNDEVTPPVTTTYTLTCTGPGGSNSDSATVTVTAAPAAPTLTVVKVVVNNNGGTKEVADFPLFIDGTPVISWATTTVATGVRTVSETNQTGYTSTITGDCAANGTITLTAGDVKKCTITNDDQSGTLIVKKIVIRDNGGSAATSTFSFQVNGGTAVAFEADGQNDLPVAAGTYTITEPAVDGYSASLDNCTNIVIANGGSATCTITNNDIAPAQPTLSLTADPTTLHQGSVSDATSTLTWDSTNADSCTASNGWTNAVGVDGSQIVQPTGTTSITYVLTCTGPGGSVTDDVTLTVIPPPLPTLIFNANPTTVNEGSLSDATTTLTWDSTNATSCVASNVSGWTGVKGFDGAEIVTPLTTSAYQLDCTGPGGTVQATTTVTFMPAVPAINHLLISEVYYDVDISDRGADTTNEWFELYNPTTSLVNLTNWAIADATDFDKFPDGTTIPAGGFLVVTAASTTSAFWGDTPMVSFENNIGSGLANGGDALSLLNVTGATTTVDALSWDGNTSVFNPSIPGVADGHSLFRSNLTVDTDTAGDWADDTTPAPGQAN